GAGHQIARTYKSTNGGVWWDELLTGHRELSSDTNAGFPFDCECAGTNDAAAGIDPHDPNHIYFAAKVDDFYSSTDGRTFTLLDRGLHADKHALQLSPPNHIPRIPIPILFPPYLFYIWPYASVYVGTDGGIASSNDGGNNWTSLNKGIATSLVGSIDIGQGSNEGRKYTY